MALKHIKVRGRNERIIETNTFFCHTLQYVLVFNGMFLIVREKCNRKRDMLNSYKIIGRGSLWSIHYYEDGE